MSGGHRNDQRGQVQCRSASRVAFFVTVRPRVIVTLGATAALSLLGPQFRLTRSRGRVTHMADGVPILATYHPSVILRAPDPAARHELYRAFMDDLHRAKDFVE